MSPEVQDSSFVPSSPEPSQDRLNGVDADTAGQPQEGATPTEAPAAPTVNPAPEPTVADIPAPTPEEVVAEILYDSSTASDPAPETVLTRLDKAIAQCDAEEEALLTVQLQEQLTRIRDKKTKLVQARTWITDDPETAATVSILLDARISL